MADFDVMVTWRKPDDTAEELPATVCYRDDRLDAERHAEAFAEAVRMNLDDFPDDLPEGSVPIGVILVAVS